jgi:hypothetical protein
MLLGYLPIILLLFHSLCLCLSLPKAFVVYAASKAGIGRATMVVGP